MRSADRQDLVFRQDYFDEPGGWQAITDLLRDIFGVDISPLDRFGGHDRSNMPSAFFDRDGCCVANFSAFAMPLMIDGRSIKAAGLQSGAVRPAFRGLGLFRDLIRITLDRCETAGFETLVLYTDKPGLYTPYGFRVVPQHRVSGPAPARLAQASTAARRLDMARPEDLALMPQLLAGRRPVSERFAVADQALMFLLNTVLVDGVMLDYLPDHAAAIAWRIGDSRRFELLDVVGSSKPSLATILSGLAVDAQTIDVHFPPDLLQWNGDPVSDDGDLVFMMRCDPALIPVEPFCLSPMAEF